MAAPARFSAFDALRAGAMELGLVLHAAVPYTRGCPEAWIACDPARSGAFDLLNTLIHAFRMPVFFLMSGFFAALLLERIGTAEFVRHRARRIGLPLLIGVLVLVPITRAIWIAGQFERAASPLVGDVWASIRAHFASEGLGLFSTIWHLWFLEYLLILTAAFLLLREVARRLPLEAALDTLAGWLVSPFRALVLAVPTIAAMGWMQGWNVDGIGELVPIPHMLVYYGIYFAAGVLLYRRRDGIDGLGHGWRLQLILGVVVVLPAMMWLMAGRAGAAPAPAGIDFAGRALSGLLTCLLLYGVTGLFVEWFDRESPRQRYMADAAYFIYLVHFPLVAILGVFVGHLSLPAFAKFGLVLAIAVPILLAVYHGAVRRTAVGRLLHGPRS